MIGFVLKMIIYVGVYNGCSPPANQTRKIAGYHAVKIVGWGQTDIDPTLQYWTVQVRSVKKNDFRFIIALKNADFPLTKMTRFNVLQNSWGPTWGQEGYFKMVWDFTDEFNVTHSSCGLGKQVVAGLPDFTRGGGWTF